MNFVDDDEVLVGATIISNVICRYRFSGSTSSLLFKHFFILRMSLCVIFNTSDTCDSGEVKNKKVLQRSQC